MGGTLQIKRFKTRSKIGLKIMVISDIHLSETTNIQSLYEIIDVALSERPDYIFVTGDIIDGNEWLEEANLYETLVDFLNKLTEIAIVLAILGNHDQRWTDVTTMTAKPYSPDKLIGILESIPNLFLLMNAIYQDERIFVPGICAPSEYYGENCIIDRTKTNVTHSENMKFGEKMMANFINSFELPDDNRLKIFLTHSARCLKAKRMKRLLSGFDMTISGHQHNWGFPDWLFRFCLVFYGLDWSITKICVAPPFRTFRIPALNRLYRPKVAFVELSRV